jgi:hypothetical protein
MFFIILLLTFIVTHLLFKKRAATPLSIVIPSSHKTAREACQDYNDKYLNPDGSLRYNRTAFRLVNDSPVFLNDNPFTSALLSAEELAEMSDDTEVFTMVVVTSSLYGYASHVNKQAKRAITLIFRSEPFRVTGINGRGFRRSWRIDNENYHVIDAHFMKVKNIEDFKYQAMDGYEFDEAF